MSEIHESIPGGSQLKLKKKVPLPEPPVAKPPPPKDTKKAKKQRKKPKPGRTANRFGLRFFGLSIGSFLLGGAVLGAFLYHQINGLDILTPEQADMARAITVIAFILVVILEAFTEDMMQGILCLFLLPYTFVYGLLFADAGPIRGLTMALLAFFAAEIYFTPDDALVPQVAEMINTWIEDGQERLINPDRPEAGVTE